MTSPALNEAMKLHAAGQVEAAQAAYAALLETTPNDPALLHLIAVTHFQRGQHLQAAKLFRKAAKLEKQNPKHLFGLAEALAADDKIDEAVTTYCDIIAADPTQSRAGEAMFALVMKHQNHDTLAKALRRLIRKHPKNLALKKLLCIALNDSGRHKEALPVYDELYRITQEYEEPFYTGYGQALHYTGSFAKALEIAKAGLTLYPASTNLMVLKATTLAATIRHAEALAMYKAARNLQPENPGLANSVAVYTFMTTDMEDGYEDYYARHRLEKSAPFEFPLPEWKGESVTGKRLVLWAEQGIGDIAMFSTLIPWVLAQNPAKLTLVVYPKLVSLFARSFPEAEVIESHQNIIHQAAERWDCHAAMGELMQYVLPHYTPSDHPPVWKTNPDTQSHLREKYRALAAEQNAQKIIGISWHTINPSTGYLRSIPLSLWKPLFEIPGIFWVSLQYGDQDDTIAALNRKKPLLYQENGFDAYEDTDSLLAQIAAIDEVITIQNATAHMGGTLGVPTTLLLSASADWRWGLTRSDSVWYESVQVMRQEEALNWPPVIDRLANELKERVS